MLLFPRARRAAGRAAPRPPRAAAHSFLLSLAVTDWSRYICSRTYAVGMQLVALALALTAAGGAQAAVATPKWRDVSLPADVRAADLLPRLTGSVKDKHGNPMAQRSCVLDQQCPSFKLDDGSGTVPAVYNVECLHGPATAYNSTIFPCAIAQAATFNPALSKEIAKAIADTLRAAYNGYSSHGTDRSFPYCFAPDVNLVRDPRYGRGQETWGEDPWLVSQFGKSFTTGLQALSPPPPSPSSPSSPVVPRQPEVAATCKHLIAYDHTQGYADAKVDLKNLVESYLMGFEGCAGSASKGGGAAMSTMCSYGLLNGVPTCGNDYLLNTVLREQLGFSGVVVSDCGAVQNMCSGNWSNSAPSGCSNRPAKKTPNNPKGSTDCQRQCQAAAAAAAINDGMDMACGDVMDVQLAQAKQWTTTADVDRALQRVLVMRMRLGMYDHPNETAWSHLPAFDTIAGSRAHKALALESARQSVILLQNRGGVLPIPGATPAAADGGATAAVARRTPSVPSIALVGPLADDHTAYLGEEGYLGHSAKTVTLKAGLEAQLEAFRLQQQSGGGPAPAAAAAFRYVAGCEAPCATAGNVTAAALEAVVAAAKASEYTIAVLGHDTWFENESRDRTDAEYPLPPPQLQMLQAIVAGAPQTKLVLVLINGMAVGVRLAHTLISFIFTAAASMTCGSLE